jgi:hypothetical protein
MLMFAFPVGVYFNKVVVWDNIISPWWYGVAGNTAAIHGDVGQWMGLIITFLFGVPSVMGLASMWFNRRS